DAKGKQILTLALPFDTWDPDRVLRCGASVCALNYRSVAVWSPRGALVGAADLGPLLPIDGAFWPLDLAIGKSGAFLLIRDNRTQGVGKRRAAMLVRIDGLPR